MKAARDEARTRESPGGQKKMTFQTRDDAYEPAHTASQTAHALEERKRDADHLLPFLS